MFQGLLRPLTMHDNMAAIKTITNEITILNKIKKENLSFL